MKVPTVVLKGWPAVIEIAETMPGPPDVVWQIITDWEHQNEWMLEASDFVVLSDQREGVGVLAEATITIGGITTRDKVRVTGWEPGKRLGIEHLGWVSGEGEIHLTPLSEDRTHFFWRETLYPPAGLLGAVGLTAFQPIMTRIFRRDVKILRGLVRARAAATGPAKARRTAARTRRSPRREPT